MDEDEPGAVDARSIYIGNVSPGLSMSNFKSQCYESTDWMWCGDASPSPAGIPCRVWLASRAESITDSSKIEDVA